MALLQHPILEEDLGDSILHNLGLAYHPSAHSVEVRDEAISLDDLLISLLLSEEFQLKAKNMTFNNTPTALYTSR